MGRPEGSIERNGSPEREIAFWLRDLRNQSGLTYDQLARRTKYSTSTLQEAASGRRLPTLNVTIAIVNACDGDEPAWRSYWAQLKRIADAEPSSATFTDSVLPPWLPSGEPVPTGMAAPTPTVPSEQSGTAEAHVPRWKRRHRQFATVATIGMLGAGAATLALAASSSKPPSDFASVVVQNKVAIGPSSLVEDKTPVYLSSETISHCTTRGCKLSGTDMWSGAKLVVTCWTRGEEMTNEDATSAGIEHNRGAYSSDRWYRALWLDGRWGYISEVYIFPADRGGKGLAQCSS